MGSIYHVLNLCTNCLVLSHDIIWIKKTYGKYVSRGENKKAGNYVLTDEDKNDKWAILKFILSRLKCQYQQKRQDQAGSYRGIMHL